MDHKRNLLTNGLISAVLALLMVLTLTACGGPGASPSASSGADTPTNSPVTTGTPEAASTDTPEPATVADTTYDICGTGVTITIPGNYDVIEKDGDLGLKITSADGGYEMSVYAAGGDNDAARAAVKESKEIPV